MNERRTQRQHAEASDARETLLEDLNVSAGRLRDLTWLVDRVVHVAPHRAAAYELGALLDHAALLMISIAHARRIWRGAHYTSPRAIAHIQRLQAQLHAVEQLVRYFSAEMCASSSALVRDSR